MLTHPRDGRTLLGHLGGHTHTTTTTFGIADTVFDGSNCGSGVVRWCAHHLQHLGSPWGIGGNAPTPRGWQDTAWSPLGGAHKHHHDHIPRCRHRVRLRFGWRTVVCTSSSASRVAMGHCGQCPHTPGMAGHCLANFGGHTHTTMTTFGVADTVFEWLRGRTSGCGVRGSNLRSDITLFWFLFSQGRGGSQGRGVEGVKKEVKKR